MLEACADLVQCERILDDFICERCGSDSLRGQHFLLNEIPVTEYDTEYLNDLVVHRLATDLVEGTRFLVNRVPACLAVFLIWQAIKGYQEGDYWSAVRRGTGVSDRRLDSKWGSAFLGFLRTQCLVRKPDTRAHRYVAPILLHAGIPDSCLPEYFRQIAWGRFVNRGITAPNSILGEVEQMRTEAQRASRSEIQDRIEELSSKRRRCERVRKLLVEYRELTESIEEDGYTITTIVDALGIAVDLAELKSQQDGLLQSADRLDEKIRELESLEDEQLLLSETKLQKVSASLREAEFQVKPLGILENDLALELAQFLSLLAKEQWERELYGQLVPSSPRGDWHWLELIIRAYEITQEVVGGNPDASGTAEQGRHLLKQQAVYHQELAKFQRILTDFLDDVVCECPERIWKNHGVGRVALRGDGVSLESATNLVTVLARTLDGWWEAIVAAKLRRIKLADIEARVRDVEQQLDAVDALVVEKTRTLRQVISGVPGVQEHGEVPDSKVLSEAQADLEKTRIENQKRLEHISEELTFLLGRDLDPNTIGSEMDEVQGQLRSLLDQKKRIEQDVPLEPLIWVDRPIQRFLLHGGQVADEFILLTVAMLTSTCVDGEPQIPEGWPGTYRYRRIWNAFSTWWWEDGRELSHVEVRLPRPRVVCWCEGSWHVGVQVPEELLDLNGLSIRHDGHSLEESRRLEGCWPLAGLDGLVEIGGTDAPALRLDRLQQKGQPCFVFRGWDDRMGPLPAARRITVGKVVVIVPEEWSRDRVASGSAPVADEAVAVPGYRAHFFNLTRDSGLVSFVLPDGTNFSLETGARQFELVGEFLDLDPDHEMGPLFVGRPPRIRPVRQSVWDGTGRVVLITRASRRREAVELELKGNQKELDLFTRDNDRGLESGCYWVVVYDRERYEMERLPFRFVPGWKGVKVQPQPVPHFPPLGGHQGTVVDILFNSETVPDIRGDVFDGEVQTEWADGRLRMMLPPRPRFDEVDLEVRVNQGRMVPVRVILERIWWALGNEDERFSDLKWRDNVVDLDRDWFRPTSQKVLWIRWPCGGQVLGAIFAVEMGFDPDARKQYLVKKAPIGDRERTQIVPIPLREFTSAWVEERGEDQSLFLWLLGLEGQDLGATVIGAYRASADPERRKSCATCDFAKTRRKRCRCIYRKWSWMTMAQFNQLRAGYVCDLWDGEILAGDSNRWVSPSMAR
ncbi:MAG: hypothetical protein C4575_13120 [Desulforudis sp.]|jgi:hypothetical protein|nr:MAG: hypothetical protein C4575_13120 [Desulforudis sp.]